MRRIALTGLLALALLALLVALWSGRRSTRGVAAPPAEATARAEESSLAGEDATPEAELAGAAAANPPAVAQRDEVARAPEAQPTCLIRVVEAGSRAPLADARAWLQRADVSVDSPEWQQAMRRFNDVEPVLEHGLGVELELDARGEARVPLPERRLLVAAARGGLHGGAALEPGGTECLVELEPCTSLVLEVVDGAGLPVSGAHVALYWGEFDPLEHAWTWISGDDGRVDIRRLEKQLWPQGYRGPVRATLGAGVACEPESVEFTVASVPREPVRLVAREFGGLIVQLTDRNGGELDVPGACHVDIEWDPAHEPSAIQRAGEYLYEPLEAGRASFPCIGLGLALHLTLAPEGYGTAWREVRGPSYAGELTRVLIPVAAARPRSRGRVLGVEACFGAGREVTLNGLARDTRVSFDARVTEGAEFEAFLWNTREVGALGDPWVLELSSSGEPGARATVVPVLDEEANVVDFGEVRFEPAPELARVRVRDESGAPVIASVEIMWQTRATQQWCDEAGLCRLFGEPSELPVEVRATHAELVASEWTPIETPGTELTLVLRRGAALEGSLLLPRGARSEDFGLALYRGASVGDEETPSDNAVLVEGGRFRFAACAPGRVRLQASYDDLHVLERDGIELEVGRTTVLEPLDLRALLFPFELTFELASGEPWNGGHLEVLEPDGHTSTWLLIGAEARASFLALRPSVDLWVAARGARPMRFQGVRDGDRLTLESALSVRLRPAADVAPPDPALVLVASAVRLAPEEVAFETYDELDVAEAPVGEDGTAWLRLPWAGTYEVLWVVRHRETGAVTEIGQRARQTIELRESAAVPVIEALLTRAEVEAALRAAGE